MKPQKESDEVDAKNYEKEREQLIEYYMAHKDDPMMPFDDALPMIIEGRDDIDEWLDNREDPEWQAREAPWKEMRLQIWEKEHGKLELPKEPQKSRKGNDKRSNQR